MTNIKQVIVIRKDLKMRRGKEIAQGSHASIAFLTKRIRPNVHANRYSTDRYYTEGLSLSVAESDWLDDKFTKVCVRVNSEQELLDIETKARLLNLEVNLIIDTGLTEFHGVDTPTCLAIGPDYSEKIDKVTGHLELY